MQAEGMKRQTKHSTWALQESKPRKSYAKYGPSYEGFFCSCATETDSPNDLYALHDTDVWM